MSELNPEEAARVCDLVAQALEQAPGARGEFLQQACGEDEALRREVELLGHEAGA